MPTETNNSGTVQSIDRAFLVLETISQKGSMSLNELHKDLNLNKPTLSRIAATLCSNGYLNKDPKSGYFSLSLRAFEVGVKAVRKLDYLSLIRNVLEKLSADLKLIAQFSIEDHNELLCLESFDQNNSAFSIYTRVGERTPLYATSAGKAILSTYPNEEIREKWPTMNVRPLTANTITDFDNFMQEISLIRQRSYALDMEENELGLFCIGTVLLNYNRKPIGAISLSSKSMNSEEEKYYSSILLKETQNLSNMLGYSQI